MTADVTGQNYSSFMNRDGEPPRLNHHTKLVKSLKELRGQDFVSAVLNSSVGINDILIKEDYVEPTMYNDSAAEFYYDFYTALSIACLNQDDFAVAELIKHGAHVTRYIQFPDGSTGTWRATFVVHRMPRHEPHILHIFVDTYPDRIGVGRPEYHYPPEVYGGRTDEDRLREDNDLTKAVIELQAQFDELQVLQRNEGDRLLTAAELKHFCGDVLWIKKPTFSELSQNITRSIAVKRERQKHVQDFLGVGRGNAERIVKLLRVTAKKELGEAITSKDAPEWMKISALFYAIQSNDVATVQKILARGVDVDAGGPGGTTAVGLAIEVANIDILELLIKAGAKLDIACAWAPRISDPDEHDHGHCFTAMYYAVGCGWVDGVKVLLKHGVGALTGSLNNSALSDLKRYKVIRLGDIDLDETLADGGGSSKSDQQIYMFIGQDAWMQRGRGGPLHWALESTRPFHSPHWPKRTVKTQKELLMLLGDACIEEINTLRSQSKRVTPVHWPQILNDLIRTLPLGQVAAILGKRWDEAEDFILGYFDEEISTKSGRADLAIDYAKHVYDGRWPESFDLIHGSKK